MRAVTDPLRQPVIHGENLVVSIHRDISRPWRTRLTHKVFLLDRLDRVEINTPDESQHAESCKRISVQERTPSSLQCC